LNPGRLGVIARMTATRYKRSDKSVRQIGNELGVEYLVEGSVRRDGEHVRITAQLVRASDQTHLWASNYDRNMGDLLELQSEVARAVAREIGVKVAGPIPRRGGQLSPEIITSYVMMKSLLSRDGYEEATKYLEQLTVSKPDDPEVWSALAMCYFNLAGRVVPQREAIEKAKYAVDRALALDPDYPRAHSVRAIIGFIYDKEWQTAEAEHLRAIEADPSDARSQMSYALFLMATGRLREAEQREALVNTLEPPQPFSCASTRLQYYAGKSADVVAKHAARFAQSPQLHVHCYWYSLAAVQQKHTDGIREAADRLAAASELQEFRSIAGYLYGRIGNERAAREQLKFLQERRKRGQWISAYNLAIIHTGLGEYSRAIDLLEEAAKEPNGMLVYLKVDPMWEPLRSSPRFAALMRSAGIPTI
jgi:tetratricopeptide (TPR) repeat protein